MRSKFIKIRGGWRNIFQSGVIHQNGGRQSDVTASSKGSSIQIERKKDEEKFNNKEHVTSTMDMENMKNPNILCFVLLPALFLWCRGLL